MKKGLHDDCISPSDCEKIKAGIKSYIDEKIEKIEDTHHNNHNKVYDSLDHIKEIIYKNNEDTRANSIGIKNQSLSLALHMEQEERTYKIVYSFLAVVITAITSVMLFNFFEQKDMRSKLDALVVDQSNIHMHQMDLNDEQEKMHDVLMDIHNTLNSHEHIIKKREE